MRRNGPLLLLVALGVAAAIMGCGITRDIPHADYRPLERPSPTALAVNAEPAVVFDIARSCLQTP